jgi:RNA 2',3'-cyclic 3'-phosphodiesterase
MKEAGIGHQKLRLFTGLYLTPEVRGHVANISDTLSREVEGVRWVPRENLHVTLKFLGSCERSLIDDLIEIMEKASELLPLNLTVGGVGAFPSLGSARVIWVGANDIDGRIGSIYKILEKGAAKYGIPREKRPYRPHITVGRARKSPVKITPEAAGRFDSEVSLEINDLVLFSSELKRTGVEYTVIERIGPSGSKRQIRKG